MSASRPSLLDVIRRVITDNPDVDPIALTPTIVDACRPHERHYLAEALPAMIGRAVASDRRNAFQSILPDIEPVADAAHYFTVAPPREASTASLRPARDGESLSEAQPNAQSTATDVPADASESPSAPTPNRVTTATKAPASGAEPFTPQRSMHPTTTIARSAAEGHSSETPSMQRSTARNGPAASRNPIRPIRGRSFKRTLVIDDWQRFIDSRLRGTRGILVGDATSDMLREAAADRTNRAAALDFEASRYTLFADIMDAKGVKHVRELSPETEISA